jgi:N-acetyl-alpha-D-glucosaminyl L-malate synthase BshA
MRMARSSSPSLRIGMVCFSTLGGSGVVASEIGMALGRRGHRVCFLSDKPPMRLDLSGPNLSFCEVPLLDYPLLAQRSYALALTAKMIEVARAEVLDLFHVHYAIPHAVSAHLARQVLGERAPKTITTLHGTDVTLVGADPKFQPLVRFVVGASDALTTPSRYLADAAYNHLGLPRDMAIEVIPNFVDTRRFSPRASENPLGGSRGNRPHVLTHVSSFRPLKRVEDVVRVFAAIESEFPSRLDLVGDGPERPRIEALVHALDLDTRVRFLGERSHLVELLQESDVFLLPSQTESFGLAALEAMACGVPVVASDVGGIAEVVRHGEAGFLAAVGDVAAMAGHVRRLFADDELHARLARRARELAETRFPTEPAVDRYEAAYRRVLGDCLPRASSSSRPGSS